MDEERYVNDELSYILKTIENDVTRNPETVIDLLINNIEIRTSIHNQIQKRNTMTQRKFQKQQKNKRRQESGKYKRNIKNEEKNNSQIEEKENSNVEMAVKEKQIMLNIFEYLLQLLLKHGMTKSDTIYRNIEQSKNGALTLTDKGWSKSLKCLKDTIKLIRPFDISKFLERYNEYKNASKQLKNENVVFFIGNTGAGKSTTIHYLKGSQMARHNQYHDHIIPIKVKNKDLLKIDTTRSLSLSVTRYITPVPLILDNDVSNVSDLNKVILCDCPGFEDTGGEEINAANALSLLDAMYAAKQVAIFLVISKDDIASRMNLFKQISDNLKDLLEYYDDECIDIEEEEYEQDRDDVKTQSELVISQEKSQTEVRKQRVYDTIAKESKAGYNDELEINQNMKMGGEGSGDSYVIDDESSSDSAYDQENELKEETQQMVNKLYDIQIIFTKFDSKQYNEDQVIDLFAEFCRENKNNQSAGGYFLADYISTGMNAQDVIIIDPLNRNQRKTILTRLFDENKITWIKATKENFRGFVSRSAIAAMQQQALFHHKNITKLLNCCRNDLNINFNLIRLKLDELHALNGILHNQQSICTNYKDSIFQVEKKWREICQNAISKMKQTNKSSTQDLVLFKKQIRYFQKMIDFLFNQHRILHHRYLKNTSSKHDIVMQLQKVYGKILSSITATESDDFIIVSNITKCDIIIQVFGYGWQGQQLIDQFKKQLSELRVEWYKSIKNNEFTRVYNGLNIVHSAQSSVNGMGSEQDEMKSNIRDASSKNIIDILDSLSQDLKKNMIQHLNELVLSIETQLQTSTNTNEENSNSLIKECKTTLNHLKCATQLFANEKEHVFGEKKTLISSINDCFERGLDLFGKHLQTLQNIINEKMTNNHEFESNRRKWKIIEELVASAASILDISDNLHLKHEPTFEKIIDDIIDNLQANTNLEILRSALKWLQQYRNDLSQLETEYRNAVTLNMKGLVHMCSNIPLSLDNVDSSLNSIQRIMIIIGENCNDYDNDALVIDEQIEEAMDILRSRVNSLITNAISSDFDLEANQKVNITVKTDYLAKLKETYQQLFNTQRQKLIKNVCNMSHSELQSKSSVEILTQCEKIRNEYILNEYNELSTILNEYNAADDSLSIFTRLTVKKHKLPNIKKDILKLYRKSSEAELKQELSDIKHKATQIGLRLPIMPHIIKPLNSNSNLFGKKSVKIHKTNIKYTKTLLDKNDDDNDEIKINGSNDNNNNDDSKQMVAMEQMEQMQQVENNRHRKLNDSEFVELCKIIPLKGDVEHLEMVLVKDHKVDKEKLIKMREIKVIEQEIDDNNEILKQLKDIESTQNNQNLNSRNHFFPNHLDRKKVENILQFIQDCKNLTNKKRYVTGIIDDKQINLITTYLQCYGEFVCKRINFGLDYFEKILHTNDMKSISNVSSDITTNGSNVSRLEEIVDINNNYKHLAENVLTQNNVHFSKSMNIWQTKLNYIYHRLNKFVTNCLESSDNSNNKVALSNQFPLIVSCVRELRRVDHCGIKFDGILTNMKEEKKNDENNNNNDNDNNNNNNNNKDQKPFHELHRKIHSAIEKDFEELTIEIKSRNLKAVARHLEKYVVQRQTSNDQGMSKSSVATMKYGDATMLVGDLLKDIYEEALKIAQRMPKTIELYLEVSKSIEEIIDKVKDIKLHELDSYLEKEAKDLWYHINMYERKLYKQIIHWRKRVIYKCNGYICDAAFDSAQSRIEVLAKTSAIHEWAMAKASELEAEVVANGDANIQIPEISKMSKFGIDESKQSDRGDEKHNRGTDIIDVTSEEELQTILNEKMEVYKKERMIYIESANYNKTGDYKLQSFCDRIKKSIEICNLKQVVNQEQTEKYVKSLKDIKEQIISSFETLMEDIDQIEDHFYDHCQKIESLTILYTILPIKKQKEHEKEFDRCRQTFYIKKRKEDDTILLTSDNFYKIFSVYLIRSASGDMDIATKLKSSMSRILNEKLDKIKQSVSGGNSQTLKALLKEVASLLNHVTSVLQNEKSIHAAITTTGSDTTIGEKDEMDEKDEKMDRLSTSRTNNTQNLASHPVMQEILHITRKIVRTIESDVGQRIESTILCVQYNSKHSGIDEKNHGGSGTALLARDVEFLIELELLHQARSFSSDIFDHKIKGFKDFINNHFKRLNKGFETSFKDLNYSRLINILNEMSNYKQNQTQFFKVLNKMNGINIINLRCYEEMIDLITAKLKEIQKSIVDEKPIVNSSQDSNQISSKRKDNYEKLKERLALLKGSAVLGSHLKINIIDTMYKPCLDSIYEQVKTVQDNMKTEMNDSVITEQKLKRVCVLYNNITELVSMNVIGGDDDDNRDKHENGDDSVSTGPNNDNNNDNDETDEKLQAMLDEATQTIHGRIKKLEKSCKESCDDVKTLASCLIDLQMAYNYLLDDKCQSMALETINRCLNYYKKKKPFGIGALSNALTAEEGRSPDIIWGKEIVNTYDMFKGEAIHLWNQIMGSKTRTIDGVLSNITTNNGVLFVAKKKLKESYIVFDKFYQKLIDNRVATWEPDKGEPENLKPLISGAIKLANKIKGNNKQLNNLAKFWNPSKRGDESMKKQIIHLMAHVLALWTLYDSKYFFDSNNPSNSKKKNKKNNKKNNINDKPNIEIDDGNNGDVENNSAPKHKNKSYLRQPQPAQVISMMKLLSIDNILHFSKNLVQIGTGEGKSLILASVACVLGLIGFDVYCVCYSQMLTRRDHEAFKHLFDSLELGNQVEYGTFIELCNKSINEDINISKSVMESVCQSSNFEGKRHDRRANSYKNLGLHNFNFKKRKRILLIDEVDTFFAANMIGNTQNIITSFKHKHITDLCDLIWKKSKGWEIYNSIEDMRDTSVYRALKGLFGSTWMPLVDLQISNMITDVKRVNKKSNHEYIVHEDKIGYKESDYISTHTSYGYETLFLYYKENEEGNISDESLKNAKEMNFTTSRFSYAELPLKFDSIVGVSATLKTLTREQMKIIKDLYNIKTHTYMPSLFKDNEFNFNPKTDIHLTHLWVSYEARLKNHIDAIGTLQNNEGEKRPIIVFFENRKKLEEFYQSNQCSDIKNSDTCQLFTEELSIKEKVLRIKNATRLNQITLATKIFGRGTDFKVNDDNVNNIGGPHVIQTFFTSEESEETQIKGRTARYGGKGSYSMVLNQVEIAKQFGISNQDIAAAERFNNVYSCLVGHRNNKCQKVYENILDKVKNAKSAHQLSERLVKKLQTDDYEGTKELILALSK